MSSEPIGLENIANWIHQNDSRAKTLFENYFAVRVGDNANEVWHGQHFEWFVNRVERDRFTEVDLAAIGALSVELKSQTARELIEDSNGVLRQLLRECELWISTHGSDLSDPDLSTSWIKRESCFQRLWAELVKPERVNLGPVKASKLMASKYPGLIPIYDSNVAWLLGPREDNSWWETMRSLLLEVKVVLEKFKLDRNDLYVTPLRKLDVVLWMEASDRLKSPSKSK